MAETNPTLQPDGSATKKGVLVAVLAVCIAAGGGIGAYIIAPRAFGGDTPAVMAEEYYPPPPSRRGGGREMTEPLLYSVENLVLNPNNTNGTRFLMASAAFEVMDEALLNQMRIRDAEIRDALNRTLGEHTVEELADLSRRDALRDSLKSTMEGLFYNGAVLRVYLPQFVIQ